MGSPVVVSGGGDGTVRVWDLATGNPVGGPFTGHDGPVKCLAAAELEGRPVVVSGDADGTVWVWDLASRASAAEAAWPSGGVNSIILTVSTRRIKAAVSPFGTIICAADRAVFMKSFASTWNGNWEQGDVIQVVGQIIAAAWHQPDSLIVGTEAGIAVIQTT